MQSQSVIWASPVSHLVKSQPDHPVLFLSPSTLQATAQAFQNGFPGLVTYAVKTNPHPTVLGNLVAAGLTAFDVASPPEMQAVRAACPTAELHYNNPSGQRQRLPQVRPLTSPVGPSTGQTNWTNSATSRETVKSP